MAPQVGDTITGAVMDPDGGVTGEFWQWARTTTPAMMDSWMDIAGETNAAYTVTEGDTGYYLRVMATYTDAVGTGHGHGVLDADHDGGRRGRGPTVRLRHQRQRQD